MHHTRYALCICTLLLAVAHYASAGASRSLRGDTSNLLNFKGKSYYLNGPNIAWHNYGWDYGISSYGNGYSPVWWDQTYSQVEQYGGNSARVWVHCKGDQNPLWDSNGFVTGLNQDLLRDLNDALMIASQHRVMVIVTLWDFYLYEYEFARALLTDDAKMDSYLDNALTPLVQGVQSAINIVAWDIINEPEWLVEKYNVSWKAVQRFVARIASRIHAVQDTLDAWRTYVTVGSASLKWNSDVSPSVGNMWSDARLRDTLSDRSAQEQQGAHLDIYQVHYYDWMYPLYDPYSTTRQHWQLDKVTLIGETGNTAHYSYEQQYKLALQNGWCGAMVWAYYSGGAASWDQFRLQELQFRNENRQIVDYTPNAFSAE